MLTLKQQSALVDAARAAVECEAATGCPAALTVAQWACESAWGTRAPGNNCFGIKLATRHTGCQWLLTTEVLAREDMEEGDKIIHELPGRKVLVQGHREFAEFETLHDCFADHAWLLAHGPYRKAWCQFLTDHDPEGFARAIAAIYATDPQYAETILKLMRTPEVTIAIEQARTVPA